MKNDLSDFSSLDEMKNHPVSEQIDQIFRSVIKDERKMSSNKTEATVVTSQPEELSLDNFEEFAISQSDELPPEVAPEEEGFELSFNAEESLDLGDAGYTENLDQPGEQYGELSLTEDEEQGFTLDGSDLEQEGSADNFGELSLSDADEALADVPVLDDNLSLSDLNLGEMEGTEGTSASENLSGLFLNDDVLKLGESEELNLGEEEKDEDSATSVRIIKDESTADEGLNLTFDPGDDVPDLKDNDLSDDALEKLKEIDALMEYDASQIHIRPAAVFEAEEKAQNVPAASPDLDLEDLDFSSGMEPAPPVAPAPSKKEEIPVKKTKGPEPVPAPRSRELGEDLKEISSAYSGEMERMQATISNLRADREELLQKIQKLEEEKVLQSRQALSVRAELDERKIELVIIRKKLNEEIGDLKDRLKLYDEKRLILEEKNRVLLQELDKAAQKNKIDIKKVQMRERELEQKLELLKSDAETQIKNRDLKILELKRKIDSMEFDMESISLQEKKSVESRYELEDKLEKAIKTLRTAITVLEDESERSTALSALKKNIDM